METVCGRVLPSTCTTAGMTACLLSCTRKANVMNGEEHPLIRYSPMASSRIAGANGRHGSRPLILLRRSRIFGSRASPKIERAPSAQRSYFHPPLEPSYCTTCRQITSNNLLYCFMTFIGNSQAIKLTADSHYLYSPVPS